MKIINIKYLEHNGEKYFEGERIVLNGYGKAELIGNIISIGNDEFCQRIKVKLDDGSVAIIALNTIENIRKMP